MKKILIVLLFLCFGTFAQQKYITKTGSINFEASVPSFEEVAAKNTSVTAILNAENGEFAALALVKAFRFKNALMEEHFNENYAESNKYPKATYKGRLENFSLDKVTTSKTAFRIIGELTFHGVTKNVDVTSVEISTSEKGFVMKGNFKVKAKDFGIEIPKIVGNKIAEDIVVSFQFDLTN